MRKVAVAAITMGLFFSASARPEVSLATDGGVVFRISPHTSVEPGGLTSLELRLPDNMAAVEGRLLYDTGAVEVVGLAPVGVGNAFRPVDVAGGVAFGVYGLRSSGGQTLMRVVIAPLAPDHTQIRMVIDAAASAAGQRIGLGNSNALRSLGVDGVDELPSAPATPGQPSAARVSGPVRSLFGDGRITVNDMDIVRADWELARANNASCAETYLEGDANGDGCVDIVDVQAVFASQDRSATNEVASTVRSNWTAPARSGLGDDAVLAKSAVAGLSSGPTFMVDSAADTFDAAAGDGVCADAANNCSLRAAITEANWWPGVNRIEFNLTGSVPVPIQLDASKPRLIIQDRSGGLTVDGYSQPGSRVNTAQFGSNAVLGVELRGTGNAPQGNAFRITSPNNIVRGFLLNNHYRAIVADGVDAHDNRIMGNWIGYTRNGTPANHYGDINVLFNNGAASNRVGSRVLANRNVSGRAKHAIELYGPGTDGNIIQNSLLCTTPSGFAQAQCDTAIDHNFGPKNGLVGGTRPSERNVIGRTRLQGIEYSHGWDPGGGDTTTTWEVNDNRAIGNWIGFRGDGSYDAAFRSGQRAPGSTDNGNGVNLHDGSNFNLIEGNYVASVYDGIQVRSSNSTGNIVRNNIVGLSPTGQPATLAGFGLVGDLGSSSNLFEGNLISNATAGGIGLHHAVRFVRLTRNLVTETNGPAIYLASNPNDPSTGANNLLPAPVITSARSSSVTGTGSSGATVELYRASRQPGQSGLPVAYLGMATVAGNGRWTVPVNIAAGTIVTALQIRANGNTSTLGTNVATVP